MGVVDTAFKPIAMRHLLLPILSAVFCNKPPTSKVLSCPEERPIYGRLQDPDGADRLSLAYQGVCQASFFSPDPTHLLTVSLRHSRSMLNDSSTQFVAALASPYRVTKK
jgi:hypothetical protein